MIVSKCFTSIPGPISASLGTPSELGRGDSGRVGAIRGDSRLGHRSRAAEAESLTPIGHEEFCEDRFVVFFWVFICVSLLICASFCGVSWRFMVIYIMECFIAISCDQRLVGTINWRIGQDQKSHRDKDPEVPAQQGTAQQGTFWVCPLSPVDGPRETPPIRAGVLWMDTAVSFHNAPWKTSRDVT